MEQISTKNLDHLGLIVSIAKSLKLEEKINIRLPIQDRKESVTRGQSVLAMIMNGLGFTERRLYMVSHFFKGKPVDILLGNGVTSDKLNDDNLGRTLDAIYNYGPTKFFSEIAFEIGLENNALSRSNHIDTTSISVHGDYNSCSPNNENVINITHGYSKDHRPDLKQLVLSLTTSGDSSFPIWLEALSGNSSDKENFIKTIEVAEKFQGQMKESKTTTWVADSCLYTKSGLLSQGNKINWLTRVPETIKEAKEIVSKRSDEFEWTELQNGYSQSILKSNYGGVEQRWFLIFSNQAYKKEILLYEEKLLEKEDAFIKKIAKFEKEVFSCKEDATKAYNKFCKLNPLFTTESILKEVYTSKNLKPGRPKAEDRNLSGYSFELKYTGKNNDKIEIERNSKGRFILSTNELNKEIIPDNKVLIEYKEQSKTENSFRFLKDPSFLVSDIFLKKPQRIQALLVVMVFCLMIYNVGEYHLRKILDESKETVPNQKGREINNPTLKWIFKFFNNIGVVEIKTGGKLIKRLITNLNPVHLKIIEMFGKSAMEIYGQSSSSPSLHLSYSTKLILG